MENKYRYINQPPNSNCSDCDAPIWVRQGIYTQYHGQAHLWLDAKKGACSYTYLDGTRIKYLCPECYSKSTNKQC